MAKYNPKRIERFRAKGQTLKLRSLCLQKCLKMLTTRNPKVSRNATTVETVKIFNSILPQILQNQILAMGIGNFYPAGKLLDLIELLKPEISMKYQINLLGDFRYAFGCYFSHNRLYWSNGTLESLNMSYEECERLYDMVSCGISKELKSIRLSTQPKALKNSRLTSIIPRAPMLTTVTILKGATDDILRLLGIHCPHLRLIDVSYSKWVTDMGVLALFHRRPKAKNSEMNECAKTITRLDLLDTSVSKPALQFACRALKYGYLIIFMPHKFIYRPEQDDLKEADLEIKDGANADWKIKLGLSEAATLGVELVLDRFMERDAEGTVGRKKVMDVYEKHGVMSVFVRETTRYTIEGCVRIYGNFITELIIPWSCFEWTLSSIPCVKDLGLELPGLRVLKARVRGTWNRARVLLPCLEKVEIWTVHDSTALSILKHSPRMKTFVSSCVDCHTVGGGEAPWHSTMNDMSFQNALDCNLSLRDTMEELCIQPAPYLTSNSVEYLTNNFPRLVRLGDVESWNVSSNQVKTIGKALDQKGSTCLLTVLSFPPEETPEYFL